MSLNVLTDLDVKNKLSMAQAVECMEDAFRQQAAGRLVAPARLSSDLQSGQLVFTLGATRSPEPIVGFRVYDAKHLHSPQRAELVAVFSGNDGSLKGLVVGPLLGAIRTGAIGGVAVKYLSRVDATSLGVIGTGFQARTQLEAATTVRNFETIRVFSRNPDRCAQFADLMSVKLNQEIRAVGSAQSAAEDADVLICATTSTTPVIQADWLQPGVHINQVGPKFKSSHEIGLDVATRCHRVVTDSPSQLASYGDEFILRGTGLQDSMQDLAAIVAGSAGGRAAPDEITLFYSLGLAGTEVLLADSLFERTG